MLSSKTNLQASTILKKPDVIRLGTNAKDRNKLLLALKDLFIYFAHEFLALHAITKGFIFQRSFDNCFLDFDVEMPRYQSVIASILN